MKQSKKNRWFTALFFSFLYNTAAIAAVFMVDQTSDAVDQFPGNGLCATADGHCTLRAAIQETNALVGADTIHVPTGDYWLSVGSSDEDAAADGDLDILDDLVISGAGIHQTTIIGLIFNSKNRIFHILKRANQSMPKVLIKKITLRHNTISGSDGNYPKGIHIYNHGELTLDDIAITNIHPSHQSAESDITALYNESASNLTIQNSDIHNNKLRGLTNKGAVLIENSNFSYNGAGFFTNSGGGAHNLGTMTIIDSTFGHNVAGEGSGGGLYSSGLLVIRGSFFHHNSVGSGRFGYGGGLSIHGQSYIVDTEIRSNYSLGTGRGVGILGSGNITLERVTISDHYGADLGAGIRFGDGRLLIKDSTLSNNSSHFGGGIFGGGGLRRKGILGKEEILGYRIIIENSRIIDNSAHEGGGVFGHVTIQNSLIKNNSAALGGGISGSGNIEHSIIIGNSASIEGGGISDSASTIGSGFTIKNSLITGNQTAGVGGGLSLNRDRNGDGETRMENTTISGNQADEAGGGIYIIPLPDDHEGTKTTTLKNVTLTNNSAPTGQGGNISNPGTNKVLLSNTLITNPISGSNCTGNITSLGYNLDSDDTCNLITASDQANADPKLDALADNGGDTQTHALLADSPAINAIPIASCPDVDQRYHYRAADTHCDIGAYESNSHRAQSGQLAFTTSGGVINESDHTEIITVTREGGNQGTVSVHYLDLGEGTAVDNDDYATLNIEPLQWADGDDSPQQFEIHIHDDNDTETTESIIMHLAHASGGASIDTDRQTTELTLLDDEHAQAALNDQVYVPLNKPCRIVDTRGFASPFTHISQTQQSFRAWGLKQQLDLQRDNDNSRACLPLPGLKPTAVMANVTAAAKHFKSRGNLVAFPSGQTPPTSSLVNFNANNIANASIIALSADNDAHFDIAARLFGDEPGNQQQAHVIIDTLGYFYSHSDFADAVERPDLTYMPLTGPCRIVHTGGSGLPFEQSGNTTQSFRAWGSKADLDTQRDSGGNDNLPECLPEPGLTPAAMMSNVTVAAKAWHSKGNAVAYPSDETAPSSSLVNFDNNNIANAAIISLSPQSTEHFSVHTQFFGSALDNQHKAHLVVDAFGYFYPRTELAGMNYVALPTPCRIVHTGEAGATFNATDQVTQSFRAWGSESELDIQRDSNSSDHLPACLPVPGLMPSAMMANVTVAAKAFNAKGNVVAYSSDSSIPSSSLVNFDRNNIANAAVITLSPALETHFSIHANLLGDEVDNLKQANVVVDVLGYFYPE